MKKVSTAGNLDSKANLPLADLLLELAVSYNGPNRGFGVRGRTVTTKP